MILTIIWYLTLLAWLGYETNLFRVRLLVGSINQEATSCTWLPGVWFAEFEFYRPDCNTTFFPSRHALLKEHGLKEELERKGFAQDNYRHYSIVLSPGVKVMCGQTWLDKHYHDLDNYVPHIEFNVPGYSQSFNLRNQSKLKQILTANFKDKRELRVRIAV